MEKGEKGVAHEHPGPGEAHDLSDHLSFRRRVTGARAVGTGRFFARAAAEPQALEGKVFEIKTFRAGIFLRVLHSAAVELNHEDEGLLFPAYSTEFKARDHEASYPIGGHCERSVLAGALTRGGRKGSMKRR